jgi:hypothetical protein
VGIYFATFGHQIWKLSDFGGFQSPEAKKTTTTTTIIYIYCVARNIKR